MAVITVITLFVTMATIPLLMECTPVEQPSSEVLKYCGYLSCKDIRFEKGEKFCAKDTVLGYCKCAENDGKWLPRYVQCNLGTVFVLTEKGCVTGNKASLAAACDA
ncbi:uncharacterized protein LOC128746100 [Sabethes cyaneus]|uniref:uncharacterized protein LOC128746100 n=1 Tax=Sabethes cyaneus TaxID=53552 RepID=UPI00237D75DB|nr:uncharacterized protein LOC128746100 [Sabethes cyaneus]